MALKINRNLQRILKIAGWALLIGLIICMVKTLIWEHNYYGTKSAEPRAKADTVVTGLSPSANPSEIPFTDQQMAEYQVESTKPRYLDIERLDLHARVKSSIVNSAVLPVPENIYDVMWYAGSGKPGENSTVLISGIIEGPTKPGAFANLDSLEKGDKISIELGNGNKINYTVVETMIIDSNEAENKLPSIQRRIDDKETLSLITAKKATDGNDSYNSIYVVRATKE